MEDVSFTYPSATTPAVTDVSMEIGAGEIVALVGENGSGKTTLAKLLCRLYLPHGGRVLWDGVDTATVDPTGCAARWPSSSRTSCITPCRPPRTSAWGKELSVGQWQRVALARAFFRDAPFIILDEPTAALDARAEHELFESIRTLCRGRSVLLISHRFSSVRSADRIYVLDGGRVVESGSHDELMALGGRYADLFTLQASAYLAPRSF